MFIDVCWSPVLALNSPEQGTKGTLLTRDYEEICGMCPMGVIWAPVRMLLHVDPFQQLHQLSEYWVAALPGLTPQIPIQSYSPCTFPHIGRHFTRTFFLSGFGATRTFFWLWFERRIRARLAGVRSWRHAYTRASNGQWYAVGHSYWKWLRTVNKGAIFLGKFMTACLPQGE